MHELYELSVQDPEGEIDTIDRIWKDQRGRTASSMREDFCGTAAVAREWVKKRPENTAVGVDLSTEVLEWCRTRIDQNLNDEESSRLNLIEGDVLNTKTDPVETVLAFNFSYFLFKKRSQVLDYFKTVRDQLEDDGLFILDAYGGSDSFLEMEEDRDLDGFTYVWDQHHYDPVTGDVVNHIHFKFPDGTKIKNAFTYHWRLWTLPEIQELLLEAGFSRAAVYWEGTDEETDEGNGVWTEVDEGEACEGWVAYLVGIK
ncbi:MAG: SAM-dependent methyltransferase [Phycisphaerae bacterium]|nr:SAM-dependent methyltransferase [Phycisphaerae bacterium]MAT80340.1 SAM-dependent methyltransferase [Phycisphaerae bacterium]